MKKYLTSLLWQEEEQQQITPQTIEKQIEEWRKKLDKFICPINQQIMIDPVIIETGQTYERKSIEEWFKYKNTCPSTGLQLKSKILTNNYVLKSATQEKIIKFIKKVIINVKVWCNNEKLFTICHELINESLSLIKNNNDCKDLQNELYNLKFDLFLKQLKEQTNIYQTNNLNNFIENQILILYLQRIKELNDINLQLYQIQKLENKLTMKNNIEIYYIEYLNLLIKSPNYDIILLKEIFTQYNKLNFINNQLIDQVLARIQNNSYLEYLTILNNNNNNYNKNDLLNKLMNIKIIGNSKLVFIPFFKNLFKKVNLQLINLNQLLNFINEFGELNDEKLIIYKQLYSNTKDIKYLEQIYNLNKNDKQIENQLLNEYLKLNNLDKYLDLYVKINKNKLDHFNLMLFKLLQNQNTELKNNLQQQENKIIYLEKENTKLNENISNLQYSYEELQMSILNKETNMEKKIKNLKHEIVNKPKILNHYQIINNFKIKYPEYSKEFIKIIKINIPLNGKKGNMLVLILKHLIYNGI